MRNQYFEMATDVLKETKDEEDGGTSATAVFALARSRTGMKRSAGKPADPRDAQLSMPVAVIGQALAAEARHFV